MTSSPSLPAIELKGVHKTFRVKGGLLGKDRHVVACDDVSFAIPAGGVLGGRPLRILFEDSAGQKEQAINAARKLIGRDKVAAIIGPTLSTEMFAIGPVAVERQVLAPDSGI